MDKESFVANVQEYETTLYRIAKTILMEEADCEDAVQNAILCAYEKIDTLREQKYFKTWLTRIMINECYKIKRAQKPRVPYEDYMSETPIKTENYSELYKAVQELKPKVRITIVLFYVEGYSVSEIKTILNIPEGTVKSRLSKGRKELKKRLEEEAEYHSENIISIRRVLHERA